MRSFAQRQDPRTLWQRYNDAVLRTFVSGAWALPTTRIHQEIDGLDARTVGVLAMIQQFQLLGDLLATLGEPIDAATMRSKLILKLPADIQQDIASHANPANDPPTLDEVINRVMTYDPAPPVAVLAAMAPARRTPNNRGGRRQGPNRPNGGQRVGPGRQAYGQPGSRPPFPNRFSAGQGICYGFAYNGVCPSPETCQFSHDPRTLAQYRNQLVHELDQLDAGDAARGAGPQRAL
jgi:hypothetical protein